MLGIFYPACLAVPSNMPVVEPRSRKEFMAGLAKGLSVLEAFSSHTPQLSITEAAQATGLSPAAARRCLLTLQELGYLSHDGKRFRPTARTTRMASSYQMASPLPNLAQPHLASVRDGVGESASLGVLDGQSVTFVARAESPRVITAARVGSHTAAHNSAAGRVFLAALTTDELEQHLGHCTMTRTAPNTLLSAELIRSRVVLARNLGYAFTDEELEPGLRSIAVPVRDGLGAVLATIGVATLSSRHTMSHMERVFLPVLLREAEALGAKL